MEREPHLAWVEEAGIGEEAGADQPWVPAHTRKPPGEIMKMSLAALQGTNVFHL